MKVKANEPICSKVSPQFWDLGLNDEMFVIY